MRVFAESDALHYHEALKTTIESDHLGYRLYCWGLQVKASAQPRDVRQSAPFQYDNAGALPLLISSSVTHY